MYWCSLSSFFCVDVILGSPPCASFGSVVVLKTVMGHQSALVCVFSQRADKVLRAPPELSTAELVEVMTVLSKAWQSPKLIPKNSLFCRVIVQSLSIVASEGCNKIGPYGWHVFEFRCAYPFSSCFWLQIAHVCHLLLWLFFFFFLVKSDLSSSANS